MRKATNIRLSEVEKQYARELSKRTGCKLKDTGSVSYGLKWCLHKQAAEEAVDIGGVYDFKERR